ncbi:hypothetical protein A6R68_14487 [Neotoma lepida]|uniref:Urotensin-2 n=1 Tax=Neotoma lepida TaxID=56216 RepID=A0A1A6HAQ0_NEOLE|nr:hypothetical protein A6R68_14487 [Neotoma lepida]
MDRLAFCCLFFIGLLNPLLSLPITDTGEKSLRLPALEEDAHLALEDLERTALLQTLRQTMGTEAGEGLREAGEGILGLAESEDSLRPHLSKQQVLGL